MPNIVYVSRRDANYRKIANEEALLVQLRQLARAELRATLKVLSIIVVCVFMGEYLQVFVANETSSRGAAELFASASLVIGLHGGGLSNVILCSPGTPLVEFALPEPTMRFFAHAAVALSLPYWPLVLQSNLFRKDIEINMLDVVDITRLAWKNAYK